MNEENPNIVVTCVVCGARFDVMRLGLGCPECRLERVKAMFKPLDELRTAETIRKHLDEHLDASMAEIEGTSDEQAAVRWHGRPFNEGNWTGNYSKPKTTQPEPAPEDCKIPKDKAAQVYELQRIRKLIGAL